MSPAAQQVPHRARVEIRPMREEERGRTERFYREAGYPVPIGEHVAWGAWEGEELVGAIAISSEGGTTILRGPEIVHARRRRGVGRSLLRAAEADLHRRSCYVIAYRHLVRMYREVGFTRCVEGSGPEFLRRRVHELNRRGWDVLLLFKPAAEDAASND